MYHINRSYKEKTPDNKVNINIVSLEITTRIPLNEQFYNELSLLVEKYNSQDVPYVYLVIGGTKLEITDGDGNTHYKEL